MFPFGRRPVFFDGPPVKGNDHGVVVEIQNQGDFRNVPIIKTKGIDTRSPRPLFQVLVALHEAVKKKFFLGGVDSLGPWSFIVRIVFFDNTLLSGRIVFFRGMGIL